MAYQLSPEDEAWLRAKFQAGDYGSILSESNKRGVTADQLDPYTDFTAQQINAYANSPTGQSILHPAPAKPTAATPAAASPMSVPDFDTWVRSLSGIGEVEDHMGRGLGKRDENGRLKRLNENQLQDLQAGYQSLLGSGFGTQLQGLAPGNTRYFTDQNPDGMPVDINGQKFARMGMDYNTLKLDKLRGGFMDAAGVRPEEISFDPNYGYLMPYDRFDSAINQPYIQARDTGLLATVGETWGPILAAMSGANLLGSFFPGLAEGGFQSLLSSLGQNASLQGGGLTDILKQFGLDGADMPWGANPYDVMTADDLSLGQSMSEFGNSWQMPAVGTPAYNALMSSGGPGLLNSAGLWAGPATTAVTSLLNSGGDPLTADDQQLGQDMTNNGPFSADPSIKVPGSVPGLFGQGTPSLMDLLRGAAPAALGAFGAKEQMEGFERMQDKYLGLGKPYRDRLDASYKPGFSMMSEPGYADAIKQSSDSVLRGLSVKSGNPFDQPNSMTTALDHVTKSTALPALQNYRSQLGTFGQLGVNTAGAAGVNAANASGGVFDAIGAGLNTALNPQTDFEKLMKQFGMKLNFGGSSF
jgi:hypothetical protein